MSHGPAEAAAPPEPGKGAVETLTEDPLLRLFSETLGLPLNELDESTSPENTLSWDSRRSMELVAMLEDTFEIELTTGEIMKMRSVGIVREVLRSKGVESV